MGENLFDEIQAAHGAVGPQEALRRLAERLKADQRYFELFDARLMQIRQRHGLPVAESVSLEKLSEPLRSQVETSYMDACREVGFGLLQQGRVRDAWRYLRPTGEQAAVAAELAKIPPDEQHLEQLIEIALHEGVAPELGFRLVLANYGICNAISAMETVVAQFPLAMRQAAAAILVKELHRELQQSVSEDVAKREGKPPKESRLANLLTNRKWLLAEGRYHVDASHLAAVVRGARIIEEREVLTLAFDLTEYGRQLHADHQIVGEEPFADMYLSHGLFFSAQLGFQIDEALEYFRSRANALPVETNGPLPAEVYVVLLARLKRYDEAIQESLRLFPPGSRQSGFAPSLAELCRLAGNKAALLERYRAENDPIGFAAALIALE